MSKKKIEIKLSFDSERMKLGMLEFFDTYQTQLPAFLKDALSKHEVLSDPAMYITEKEIRFSIKNTNKGAVLVYADDKQDNFKTIDYKLVSNDEPYIKLENNQLVIFYKRGGEPDDTIAVFPDLEMAIVGLKSVEDPILVQKRIEEIDARDKDRNEEVLAELKEAVATDKKVVEEKAVEMKVVKE